MSIEKLKRIVKHFLFNCVIFLITNVMSGPEYLIGTPIDSFPVDRLPTNQDVIRFYVQYWGVRESESKKESAVADELIKIYHRKNVTGFTAKSIKYQIGRIVRSLKTILKLKSKVKTEINIQKEAIFRSMLDETFQPGRESRTSNVADDFHMDIAGNLFFICIQQNL